MAPIYPDLDTPLLKVSRPVAACSRCRNAKIKCDGKLPACSACEKAGRGSTCSGATDEFAKGKERSYVASLEAQCERLEKKIEAAKRRQQGAFSGPNSPENEEFQAAPATASLPSGGDASYGKEASDIDDLVGDFGFLAVNATSRDFYGISSPTSFAGLLLTLSISQPLPRSCPKIQPPPHPQVPNLTRSYFDNFYPLMPFLSETKFWASVNAIYQDGGRFANSFDHWTFRMVLAIDAASRSSNLYDHESNLAMSHVDVALGYAEDVLKPGTIAGIQAILLLAQYSTLNPKYFRTWYLIGIAARVVTDLGIHQEHASAASADKMLLDSRRRTFHCVYSLDRYVSIALDRAFSFSDDSIDVPLPSEPSPGSSSSRSRPLLRSTDPAIRLFQIRHFQSAAYQDMYFSGRQTSPNAQASAWDRCSAAATWHQSCVNELPASFSALFELEYLYTLILVLSPSVRSPTVSETSQILLLEYSIDFVSKVYSQIVQPTVSQLTYVDIERTYTVIYRLSNLLRQNHSQILQKNGLEPQQPYQPATGDPILPAALGTTTTTRQNPTGRANACFREAHAIFTYALRRWDVRALLDDFNRTSSDVIAMLSSIHDNQQRHSPQAHFTSPSRAIKQSQSPEFEPKSFFPGSSISSFPAQHMAQSAPHPPLHPPSG